MEAAGPGQFPPGQSRGMEQKEAAVPCRRRVYRGLIILSLLFAFLASGIVWAEGDQLQARSATVNYLQGKAEVQRAGAPSWQPLALKAVLKEGDRVRAHEGTRLELTLDDRSVVRFSEATTFVLVQLKGSPRNRQSHTRIRLLLGKIWANVNKMIAPQSTFEIQSQTAIAGTRATVYRLSLNEDKSTVIKVYEGAISVGSPPKEVGPPPEASAPHEVSGPVEVPSPFHEVSMEEWTQIVEAVHQIYISPQGVPGKPEKITTEAGEEEWVAWNQERDKGIRSSN